MKMQVNAAERVVLTAFTLVLAACGPAPTAKDHFDPNAYEKVMGEAQAAIEVARPSAGTWEYSATTDPLTDKVSRTACVTSTEQVMLPSPYQPVRAQLCLRDSPQFGHDAYVALLGDGQFMVRSYATSLAQVRFDKEPASSYSIIGASDGSSNIAFITNRSRLETHLKGADQTIIAAEFYQAGTQIMTFNTAGFSWPALQEDG